MKSVNINQLQDQVSKVIREVEKGETVEIIRYSKPVGYLLGVKSFDELTSKSECKKCISDLRKIAKKIE